MSTKSALRTAVLFAVILVLPRPALVAAASGARPASSADAFNAMRAQIAELRREIARHDELYFKKAQPEIADAEYDELRRRLAQLEAAFPDEARSAAPLPAIADDRAGVFGTKPHRQRMLSLEKAHTDGELRAFDARLRRALDASNLEYVVEPKYDGVAVSITYEHGRLAHALTRGNGAEGEDITAHVREIPGVPQTLPGSADLPRREVPAFIEIRGELYVPLDVFAGLNANRTARGEPRFTHPRSVAAGALRQRDPRETSRKGVCAVFFGVGACEPAALLPASQSELRTWLEGWKLPVARQWVARGADELVHAVADVRQARTTFGFPVDGCVVKLNARDAQRRMGESDSAPRWAIAFKYSAERVETQLLAITIQVGRTGILTPVAELAPVELDGTTVSRATLHNRDEIARRDIRVGDFVWVEKVGEIIPAVVGVNLSRRAASARPFQFPNACPACGSTLMQRETDVAERCGSPACRAQLRRKLEHFVSKACVDIPGLGPAVIEALVARGTVKDIGGLYGLRTQDLLVPGKVGVRSAAQILAAIEESKRGELWRFIHGLGIPGVGMVTSRELALEFRSLEALMKASGTAGGAGAAAAFFSDSGNRAIVAALVAAGVRPVQPSTDTANSALAGKTFALTGSLPTMTRSEASSMIEAAGGKTSTSVSRKTSYLVAGSGAGTKLEEARKHGVTVIDEAELRRMVGSPATRR